MDGIGNSWKRNERKRKKIMSKKNWYKGKQSSQDRPDAERPPTKRLNLI